MHALLQNQQIRIVWKLIKIIQNNDCAIFFLHSLIIAEAEFNNNQISQLAELALINTKKLIMKPAQIGILLISCTEPID